MILIGDEVSEITTGGCLVAGDPLESLARMRAALQLKGEARTNTLRQLSTEAQLKAQKFAQREIAQILRGNHECP